MEQEKTSAEDPKHSWEKMKYCCSFKDYKNKTKKTPQHMWRDGCDYTVIHPKYL